MSETSITKSFAFTAWSNWGISTAFVIFQFFLQTAAGVMVPQWKQDFHIGPLLVANLSAAFFYVYVSMQIPAGLAYDRFKAKGILTFAAITLAAGCLLLSYTHDYSIAFLSRMLMGVGASFGFVGMLQISAQWFSAQAFPIIISLSETIGMASITAGEILLAWLVVAYGWRESYLFAGITAVILAILILIFIKEKPNASERMIDAQHQGVLKTLFLVAKSKQTWLAGMYGFFGFSIVNVFTSLWGVPFLRSAYHLNLHTSANMVSMVFLGIACGSLIISWISSYLGRRKPMLIISAFISTALTTILLFVPNLPHIAIYLILLAGGFFCASYVLCFTLIKETSPKVYRASALAMTNMLIMLSAPLLQPFVGWLIVHNFFGLSHTMSHTYRYALAILPLGLLISGFMVFFMQESYCRELPDE